MIDDRGGGRPFSCSHQMGKKIFIGKKNMMSPVLSNGRGVGKKIFIGRKNMMSPVLSNGGGWARSLLVGQILCQLMPII